MVTEWKCKGSHVIVARDVIDEKLGGGTFARIMASRDATWGSLVLTSGWYDVDALIPVLTEAAQRCRTTVEGLTAEIARRNAERDLTTMYRVFLRVAAPVRVLGFTSQLWGAYVAFGTARAMRNEPGIYLGEGAGIPKRMFDWACGAWTGFIPAAVELAGGRNVRGTVKRREPDPKGGDLMRLEFEVLYDR